MVELIDLFLAQVGPVPSELHEALTAGDEQTVARVVHTLQSSAGNLGARRLQRLCKETEAMIRGGQGGDVGAMVEAVTAEIGRVVGALQVERQRSAA